MDATRPFRVGVRQFLNVLFGLTDGNRSSRPFLIPSRKEQIQNPKIRCEATNELEMDLDRSSLTGVRLEPFGILIESSAVGFGDTSSLYRSTS